MGLVMFYSSHSNTSNMTPGEGQHTNGDHKYSHATLMTEINYPTLPSTVKFDLRNCTESDRQFSGTFEENLRKIENLKFPEADKWVKALGLDTLLSRNRSRAVPRLPVLVTAATPRYFDISQGLIKTVHEVLLPKYPDLKFIYYSLGLRSDQVERLRRYCRCEVRDFEAIQGLPLHARKYQIYAFKPIIVAEVFQEYGHVFWVDTSVRFLSNDLKEPLRYLKQSKFLYFTYGADMNIGQHTMIQTFSYFKEHPCPYGSFGEVESGNTGFYDSHVTRVVVKKWLSCALIEDCIAPQGHKKRCTQPKSTVTGTCHRYDQSALGIMLRRLYHDRNDYPNVTTPFKFLTVKRENRVNYLPL